MQHFAIRVYKPDTESPVTCIKYPEAVGKAANITLICQHDVYGRYIKFIRLGGVHLNKVTLCEVEIKGKLHTGVYQHLILRAWMIFPHGVKILYNYIWLKKYFMQYILS